MADTIDSLVLKQCNRGALLMARDHSYIFAILLLYALSSFHPLHPSHLVVFETNV